MPFLVQVEHGGQSYESALLRSHAWSTKTPKQGGSRSHSMDQVMPLALTTLRSKILGNTLDPYYYSLEGLQGRID